MTVEECKGLEVVAMRLLGAGTAVLSFDGLG